MGNFFQYSNLEEAVGSCVICLKLNINLALPGMFLGFVPPSSHVHRSRYPPHTIHQYFIRVASFKSSVFILPKSFAFPLLPFSSGNSLALILQYEPFLHLLSAIRRTVSPTK